MIDREPKGVSPDQVRPLSEENSRFALSGFGGQVTRTNRERAATPLPTAPSSDFSTTTADPSGLEALAYVMANPVAAGLVRTAADWPGVMTLPHELGRACWTVRRASQYFDPDNLAWPETATLRLTLPPVAISADDLRVAVQNELERLEREAHEQMRGKGRHFIGRARLASLSPYARARSWEPLRSRNPTFAVGRSQREAFMHAVAAIRAFREAYRSALQRWRIGCPDAVFPAETWLMRWVHGAATAS